MSTPPKADPTIYPKLREHALQMRIPGVAPDAVQAVLMDWRLGNGTATVLAAMDGTGSMYLSSGGGFIGGGQKDPALREAALFAVRLGTILKPRFTKTETFELPAPENVAFYLTTGEGVYTVQANDIAVRSGTDPLTILGAAMQMIVTQYRFIASAPPASNR
jgi:hypothetical protein